MQLFMSIMIQNKNKMYIGQIKCVLVNQTHLLFTLFLPFITKQWHILFHVMFLYVNIVINVLLIVGLYGSMFNIAHLGF